MRFPRWVWWSIIGLVVASAFVSWFYYVNYCHCQCDQQKEYSERWGWPCKLVGEPDNLLTFFGLLGAAAGFLFISGQMTQTDESIRLSRESLRLYRERERGRLAFMSVKRVSVNEFSFTFENSGPTSVTVLEVGRGQWVEKESAGPSIPRIFMIVGKPNKVGADGVYECLVEVPDGILKKMTSRSTLRMVVRIRYETVLGAYVRQVTTELFQSSDDPWDYGLPWSYDLPLSEVEAR